VPTPRRAFVRAWKMQEKERSGQSGSFSPSLKPGMAYLIDITARAERDLDSVFEEIHASDSVVALNWYRGLFAAILTLEKLPSRCAFTRENHQFRHLLYGHKPHVYRVIYRVLEKQKLVEVLHVRHGARREFSSPELE
jgi:plasmid stabilization system protein ParE